MRKPIIAGNWKMYKTAAQAVNLVRELDKKLGSSADGVEVVLCPPFVDLKSVATVIELDGLDFGLGAQNMHWEDEGAYTGEVSPVMLKDLMVDYVIIGHSERRQYFGETDQSVNKKILAACGRGLKPILCVGETLEEHDEGLANKVVQTQLRAGLEGVDPVSAAGLVVAYEPIWAIGTGRTATPEQAEDVIRHARAVLGSLFSPEAAREIRIQYGGSVKPENIALFMAEPDIDGALVGGASLDAGDFAAIVRYEK